nr:sarcosine oxidase subunit gamma family protein [Planomonospora venezuelensis]
MAEFAGRFAAEGSPEAVIREVPFLPVREVRGEEQSEGLRLGPDWWLVAGGPAGGDDGATAGGADPAAAAGPGPGVDVSAQWAVVELAGPGVRDVLMTGCPIDLHPEVFTTGSHTRTLLGRVPVVLHRVGPDVYRVLAGSSLAGYLAEWLLDALEGL